MNAEPAYRPFESGRRLYVWRAVMLALALAGLMIFVLPGKQREQGAQFTVRSKDQLLRTMRRDPYFTAIERRFPEVANDAIERGWRARELSGSDVEVSNAMRKAITGIYPTLVAQADDASLESFAMLAVEQAKAARAISDEACGKLLDAELNIATALPPEYFDRERAWVIRALDGPANDAPRRTRHTIATSMDLLRSSLKPEQLSAVMFPAAYRDQPVLRCDSAIALYDAALSLPADEKAAALEGLLKR